MIYPANFERKIGFDEIRTLLKGRCLSTLGTEWIDKEICFQTQYVKVKRALDEASEYARFDEEAEENVESEFYDVREALMRARPERTWLEELDLYNLKRSITSVAAFAAAFTKPREQEKRKDDEPEGTPIYIYPALAEMAGEVQAFPEVISRIDAVLNKYGRMKDTASAELLSLRHQIEVTTRGISHSLRSIIVEAQKSGYIERDVAPTLRDGRLVIPVPPAMKRKVKGIVHDESATGKTVFIEPTEIVDANNRIRELRAAERREVVRILQELTAFIRPHIPEILSSLHFLAHIDYLRALTAFSRSIKAIVPELHPQPAMNWRQARHPLLQASLAKHGGTIVPLDIKMNAPARILLISGPNAGGKSVCLKTAALLQYMLQCGMPVPVDEASRPGIFKSLFIDIGDEQSIEDDLSTYSSHLLNMKEMMRRADRDSLVLIDEFGGGTEPQIGGALAQAMLSKFVEIQTWGIITTHYQNLKRFAAEQETVVNGAMLYDRSEMKPLYLLQVGNPGSSFAVEIARKIGIPDEVIRYATDLVGKDYIDSDKYLQDIVRDKMYWERKRQHVHQREKQLDETLARYETEMTSFQRERKTVLAQAKQQAQQMLEASNAKIENTIRSIKQAQAEREKTREARAELQTFKEQIETSHGEEDKIARQLAKIKRRQQRKQQAATGEEQKANTPATSATKKQASPQTQQPNKAFAKGDYVRMDGQTSVGRIEALSRTEAKVLFGSMYMQVALGQLRHAAKPEEDKKGQVATYISRSTRDAMSEKRLNFRPEIDIRGMHADEALSAVAYFIDDAILCEQSRVRILHGTGTGALRELVRNYLGTVAGVRTFHDEHVQFGGAGITVAEME